jgi:hypothetical protein
MLIPQVEYNTIRWSRSRIWVRIERLYPFPPAAVRDVPMGWSRAAEVVDAALASPGKLRVPHRRKTG